MCEAVITPTSRVGSGWVFHAARVAMMESANTQKTRSRGRSFGRLPECLKTARLLTKCEVLDGHRGTAEKECPEKEGRGLKDAHDAVFLRWANHPWYRNEAAAPNGRPISPGQMQNSQIRNSPD